LPTGVASVQDFSGIAGVVLKAAVARLPLRVGQILEKMRMLAKRHHLIAVAAATMALGFAATAADAAGLFTLSSTTFSDGKIMPKKVANSKVNAPNNPNCVGDNVSPQFSWNNVPDGTKSFAFLMIDPEGRAPGGVNHWVAYGIPASVTGFAEGEVSKESDKYVGGKSTQGVAFYSGPCTPPNQTAHHYTFVLIATDFDPKELPPGLTRDELTAKFGAPPAHVKGVTGMIGQFINPWHE
jgi:Raf kinase inhibitor-like YbhB/YbcL family protein